MSRFEKSNDLHLKNIDTQLADITQFVTYSMYGLDGTKKYYNSADGNYYLDSGFTKKYTNNDAVQIKQAHDYANANNLPVINLKGDYVLTDALTIDIQTDVYWGKSTFHMDESKADQNDYRFSLVNDEASYNVTGSDLTTFSTIFKKGINHLDQLKPHANSFIYLEDDNTTVAERWGNVYPIYMSDMIFVTEGGHIIGDIMWDFTNLTTMTVYPAKQSRLTIDGGIFLTNGKMPTATASNPSNYFRNGFYINRSFVTIRNQYFQLEEGATDNTLSAWGFYDIAYAYDVILEDIYAKPRNSWNTSTSTEYSSYTIRMDYTLNIKFKNITSESVDDYWGTVGTFYTKDVLYENCNLNRIDSHYQAYNLTIKGCNIGLEGMQLVGGGKLYLENTSCCSDDFNFISFRPDEGAHWDGDIIIKNCSYKAVNGENQMYKILNFSIHDYDYKFQPRFGKSIIIDGFETDFSLYPGQTSQVPIFFVDNTITTDSNSGRILMPNYMDIKNMRIKGTNNNTVGYQLMQIAYMQLFQADNTGLWDGFQLKSNVYYRFSDIQLSTYSDISNYTSWGSSHLYLDDVGSSLTYTTEDNYLYPTIEINNCKNLDQNGITLSSYHYPVKFILNDTKINCLMCQESSGGSRTILYANRCEIQSNVASSYVDYLRFYKTNGIHFTNCLFRTPIVDGTANSSYFDKYAVLQIAANKIYGNHSHSQLENSLYSSLSPSDTFKQNLISHTENQSYNITPNSGTNIPVTASAITKAISFTNAQPDIGYSINVSTTWNTSWWITGKNTGGFTINFGTAPVSNSNIDWAITRG